MAFEIIAQLGFIEDVAMVTIDVNGAEELPEMEGLTFFKIKEGGYKAIFGIPSSKLPYFKELKVGGKVVKTLKVTNNYITFV